MTRKATALIRVTEMVVANIVIGMIVLGVVALFVIYQWFRYQERESEREFKRWLKREEMDYEEVMACIENDDR